MRKLIRPFKFTQDRNVDLTFDGFKITIENSKNIKAVFMELFYRLKNNSINKQQEIIQTFYRKLENMWNNWREFKKFEISFDIMLIFSERYICEKTYDILFENLSNHYMEKDIQTMRFLQLLKVEDRLKHLAPSSCCFEDDLSLTEQLNDSLVILRRALLCKIPSWKVDGIVAFSKRLLGIIEESQSKHQERHASADDFVPLLIYAISTCNPSLIHVNIEFVNRFCNPAKLSGGECAYYYTSFCAAVSFIDNIDAEHLNVDNDTFIQIRLRSIPDWYRHYEENLFRIKQVRNYKIEINKRIKNLQHLLRTINL